MLLELKISNLAIIKYAYLNFDKGINVLTGETGSGKSIMLEALNIILGGRSGKDYIRTGEKEAWIEALFEADERVINFLKTLDININDDEVIALRRVINKSGRSRCYINCVNVPAHILKKVGNLLVDFARQNEQSSLLNPSKHLELIDKYGNLVEDRKEVESIYNNLISLIKEYSQLEQEKYLFQEKREFLNFQRNNILEIDPQPNEEEELTQELERLNNIKECKKIAKEIVHELYNSEDSIQSKLSNVINNLEKIVERDNSVKDILEDLENVLISIEEAGNSLQNYEYSLNYEPDVIEELQERLDTIIELQNKYGGTYEDVINRLKNIEKELNEIDKKEKRLEELSDLIELTKEKLCKKAIILSEKRKKIIKDISKKIIEELEELGMKNAKFEVKLLPLKENFIEYEYNSKIYKIGPTGLEQINFLLSTNPGEDLKPLQLVASGGELSRILLVIKNVLASVYEVQTLIFDEIDAGISGETANLVALKLKKIIEKSNNRLQIICISHTPQIAGCANKHFQISKKIDKNSTYAVVKELDKNERIKEIARIMTGKYSNDALKVAKELIK